MDLYIGIKVQMKKIKGAKKWRTTVHKWSELVLPKYQFFPRLSIVWTQYFHIHSNVFTDIGKTIPK